jgi:hypothetical protein
MATKKQEWLSQGGANPITIFYGKDGRRYDTWEAAQAADRAYDMQMGSSGNKARDVYNASKGLSTKSGSSSAASSNMTNEFLSKWGEINQETLSLLTKTLEGTFSGESPLTGIYSDLMSNIQNQISSFDEQYGGYTQRALDSTMEDIDTRRGLVKNITNLAQPDYAGVSGRAAADVAAQSELSREEAAINAMSYGVDPTSGKFGALTKKSTLNEARDKVRAMNEARTAEKNRVTGLNLEALHAVDPTITAKIASDLMGQKTNLLGLQTNAAGAMTSAEKAKADTAIAVANAVGNIGSQYGSAGLTLLGINEGRSGEGAGTSEGIYTSIYGDRGKKLDEQLATRS